MYRQEIMGNWIEKHSIDAIEIEGFFNREDVNRALEAERAEGWEFVQVILANRISTQIIFRYIQ